MESQLQQNETLRDNLTNAVNLTEHRITINNKKARHYSIGEQDDNKPNLHFYGGNGFAVGAYIPLLSALDKDYNVISLAMRGAWHDKPTQQVCTRGEDADMLIEYLEKTQTKPIVAVGHSQGATATAIACAKRPDLFEALYLIDPVSFTANQAGLYKKLPRLILESNEPFKSTAVKKSNWDSIDAYYEHLRAKFYFKRVSDENLYLYAKHSLIKKDDGYTFLFPPEQELANYFGIPFIDNALKKVAKDNIPYTFIMGKPSIFASQKVRKNWLYFTPKERLITLKEYGHLIPIEAPQQCADIILRK